MKINFDWKLFNPNFWHLKELLFNHEMRNIWFYGGSSSSKTYSIVQGLLMVALKDKTDTIVFRKTGNSIEKTVYKDFQTVVKDWNLEDQFRFTRSPMRIKCITGAVIDFSGMDDSEKIKGISQYKRVYCNEISSFDEVDYKQIRKRLRGMAGQQIIADFNPIDELHWIKTNVFDRMELTPLPLTIDNGVVSPEYTQVTEKLINGIQRSVNYKTKEERFIPPNTVIVRSTFLNNFWAIGSPCGTYGFVDDQLLADFESDKLNDFNFYKVYALGEWGRYDVGGEFYKKFKRHKHVRIHKYNPNFPLHLSFDENVNPYLSLSVYQAKSDKAWKIAEICLEHPRNNLSATLFEFISMYPNHDRGIFVYGDRTSLKEDTKLEKGQNFFTIIMRTLGDYHPKLRLPSHNPPVVMRGNFINDIILEREMYTVSTLCKQSIADYEYTKEESDGTKYKEVVRNPVTKIKYQKWGHLTDTDDYFLCEYFKREFGEYQRGRRGQAIISERRRGIGKKW